MKKHINTIILIFIYLIPFIDLTTSICINILEYTINPGMIIKMLFLMFLIYYVLFIKRDRNKFIIIYTILIFIYMIIYIFINRFLEISEIIKIMYFPIMLLYLSKIDIKYDYKLFVSLGIIYLLFIFIPEVLNIDFNSYTQGKVGSVGLFNSSNEISGVLSILTPFLIYYIFNNKSIIKKVLLSILILYVYFNMGSKIIILSLVISIIFNIYLYIKNNNIKIKYYIVIPLLILFIVLGIILIPNTNIYYNIILHLKFLNINTFSDIFTYKFINEFIFSSRLTFLNNIFSIFKNSSILNILFGICYSGLKTVEMDLFDILFRSGIVGLLLVLVPIIYILKRCKYNDKLLVLSIILGFGVSILSGHVLVSPGVGIYLILVIGRCLDEKYSSNS